MLLSLKAEKSLKENAPSGPLAGFGQGGHLLFGGKKV
jgi:hypothetical protein